LAYKITYKKSVQKDLSHLGRAEAGRIIDKIEKALRERADACPMLKGEFAGLRKLRIGAFRVIYTILGGEVLIMRIGHRRDVYKR
jgi:mRNA interferase RelE/StbE